MNPLEQYKNTKTVIHCPTQQEADAIGELIKQMGGNESLAHKWSYYKENFCLNLEKMYSCTYGDTKFFTSHDYDIILASEILKREPEILNNYQIF